MLENLTSPVPLWLLIILFIGIWYELNRKRNKENQVKNTDNYYSKLSQPIYKIPIQHKLKLSAYGKTYEESLQSFQEKKAQTDDTEKLWKEVGFEELDAAIIDHMRYYQQYLNRILAPSFIVELTDDKWGHLNTYDEPVDALCLKVFRYNQEVGRIEVQPDTIGNPWAADIEVRLNTPEFFEYSEIYQLFRCIAQTHYNDDEPNKHKLDNVIHDNLTKHLWNYHHGARTAKFEGGFNTYEAEPLQMTFTGTCDDYTRVISAFTEEGTDLFEAEIQWIKNRAERDGLILVN